jgi:hypothetical protein
MSLNVYECRQNQGSKKHSLRNGRVGSYSARAGLYPPPGSQSPPEPVSDMRAEQIWRTRRPVLQATTNEAQLGIVVRGTGYSPSPFLQLYVPCGPYIAIFTTGILATDFTGKKAIKVPIKSTVKSQLSTTLRRRALLLIALPCRGK